jgi:Beta-L-arabinofuranosidase, GH127
MHIGDSGKYGRMGMSSVLAATRVAHADVSSGGTKLKIPYVRDTAPEFEIPPYRGESYEDTIPDTLDLTERLRLAVHAATSITDPLADSEVYWLVDFHRNPPVMMHDFNDWVLQLEGMLEAVPLARTACGSTENEDVDHTWMANWVLKGIGPDGLIYIPLDGRPWGRKNMLMANERAFRPDGSIVPIDDPSITQIGSAYTSQRVLSAMTIYYLRDGNPMWRDAGQKMIDRLVKLAVYKDDYAYYPDGMLEPNATYGSVTEMPIGARSVEWGGNGRLIQGLSQFYLATGYEPSIQLAAKLTKYLAVYSQSYTPDGAWLISDVEKSWLKSFDLTNLRQGGHSTHAIGAYCMLEYGLAVHDREANNYARGIFEWARANSVPRTGFFPEFLVPGYHTCETCIVADQITLAVKLSAGGIGDYWDDVDRWVRNQFTEQQLTSTDWVYQMAERQPRKPVQPNETADRVAERNVGAFAGWAAPNDFTRRYLGYESTFMHCCMGNGTRAMYYTWEHILEQKPDELRVHLLLNRASAWADIYSHVPYQGKVEVKLKKSFPDLVLRVPEWIETGSSQVKATRGGAPLRLTWEGRYVRTGPVNQGDVVTLTFPIATQTVKEMIAGTEYTLEIKGNTVVSISPGGENGPLYRREYFRAGVAPTKKVQRFVAEKPLLW